MICVPAEEVKTRAATRTVTVHRHTVHHARLYSMEPSRHAANQVIESLSSGNMAVLDQLYDQHRDDFLRWAGQRFQGSNRDDLLDVWHDTMIMFYEQIRDRKLTQLTCEVKTFLFTIGYRRLQTLHQKAGRTDLVEKFDDAGILDPSLEVVEMEEVNADMQKALKDAIEVLPKQSRQILLLRYLEGKSIPDIMKATGYTSENAVSVTLSRGLKKLKELITERMPKPQ